LIKQRPQIGTLCEKLTIFW